MTFNQFSAIMVLPKEKEKKKMIAKKCIHPIKANYIIADFANSIIEDAYYVARVKYGEQMQFSMIEEYDDCYEIGTPNWKEVDYKNDYAGKCFRKDFVNRCPLARGFSDITISILHEIGHSQTIDLIPPDYDRAFERLQTIIFAKSETELHQMYFALVDETLATNWAIEWLNNAENRKLAKAFEKSFFACFE